LVPFQAAFVDDYDMYYALQQLSRPRLKALFARPYRPGGEATAHGEGGFIAFEVDEFSGEVRAAEDANPAAADAPRARDQDDPDDAGEVTGEPAADLLPFEWPVTTSASDEPAAGSRPAGNKKGARGSHPARQPAKLVNGRKNGHGRTSPRSEPPASGDLVYERDDDFVDWEEPEG
jgi:hypothetical protein